ncbi:hypothetical protein Tco_1410607 [Tanacetum coccineum]
MSMEALQAQEDLMKSIESFLKKFNRISFGKTPKVLLHAWDNFIEVKHAQPEEVQELLSKLVQDMKIISDELSEYINTPAWNRPLVYCDDDDDNDYTTAITPVLSTEEPVNSLIMENEHLDTISATESDEFIKSSVEILVPIQVIQKVFPKCVIAFHEILRLLTFQRKINLRISPNLNVDSTRLMKNPSLVSIVEIRINPCDGQASDPNQALRLPPDCEDSSLLVIHQEFHRNPQLHLESDILTNGYLTKGRKNQSKRDKTGHGMEKYVETKPNQIFKLHKEKEHLKQTYKDLFDSIKTTRVQTKNQNDSLMAQLNKKSNENADVLAQIQKKGFAIAALKNELRKLTGNSVNTKFAKPSILGKPVLQPHRNQSVVRQPTAFKSERPKISKPRFASQVDVNNDLSKPVTTHYLPKRRESAHAKPHYMIAPSSSRYSSNDIVHNHYLEEAKKKTQEHSRNSRNFSDSKHFVCSTCQKCVFNANHDSCVTKFLKEVNSRAKVPSNKTTNRNKPVEQIRVAMKPNRQIPTGHGFSIKRTSTVHEKTTSPRSCLRWKPTGRILKTVCLRWVPTGKIFTSSTTKVDSEPPNGSKKDITNQCESEQALDVSADISENRASRNFDLMINMMTFEHNSSSLGHQCQMMSDHNSSDLAPQRQEMSVENVSSGLVATAPASDNYGVTCEDEGKRHNSGTKTKTFEENCYLLLYAVSSKEDTVYQRQLITRIRVMINSLYGVSLFTYTPYAQLVISQRYEVNVIDGN